MRWGAVGCMALLLALTVRAQPPVDQVEALLATMTLEQRVGQMFMSSFYGGVVTESARDFLLEWQPGAVVLFDSNIGDPAQTAAWIASYQSLVEIPLLVAVDQEGGRIARLRDGFTEWPAPMLLTASGDVDLAYRVGAAMGAELRAVGVTMNLSPVVDLLTNRQNTVIGRRSPGDDPALVGAMWAAFSEGMQSSGVLATAKHFPGHGDTSADSHLELPVLNLDRARLEAVELAPFRALIEAQVGAVMVAHLALPLIDDGLRPASLSRALMTDLLRDELGFTGVIVTDALDMDAIDTVYSLAEASILAIQAGADLIAVGAEVGEVRQAGAMQAVVDAVRRGDLPEAQITASARRILQAKARLGLLDGLPVGWDAVAWEGHLQTSAAAVEALFAAGVTLAGDDAGIIPFSAEASVGLIYPANRSGIGRLCGVERSGIQRLAVSDAPSADEIRAAGELAGRVDRVVLFTRNAEVSPAQQSLARVLPGDRTVVVALISPYDWEAFPHIGAYLATYSAFDAGIVAACEVVFGQRVALGRLPVTIRR